jgi:hypothetical protein
LVALLSIDGEGLMFPLEVQDGLVLVVVAQGRPDRENFTAVAYPVVEEIGMACQLICDAEDNIAVSRVVPELTVVTSNT